MSSTWRLFCTGMIVSLVLSLATLSCKEYDYSSPLPGVLEIRLRSLINDPLQQSLLPFAQADSVGRVSNAFMLLLKSLRVLRSDGSEQEIYSDLHAIRRNDEGDFFNCLDMRARDSVWVLGESYVPPTNFNQLWLTVQPRGLEDPGAPTPVGNRLAPPIVRVHGQYSTNIIEVRLPTPTPLELRQLTTLGQSPLDIKIEEGRRTVVTVTFDLDQSLVRRAEWYEYRPTFYITSIEHF